MATNRLDVVIFGASGFSKKKKHIFIIYYIEHNTKKEIYIHSHISDICVRFVIFSLSVFRIDFQLVNIQFTRV